MDFSVGVHYIKNSYIDIRYVVSHSFVNLDRVEVIPELRGCGVGTRYVKELIEQSPLPVLVTILYHRPLTFYISLGFKIIKVYGLDKEGRICDAVLTYEPTISKETKYRNH